MTDHVESRHQLGLAHGPPLTDFCLLCLTFLTASITSVGWSFLLVHLLMGSPTDCHVKEGWDFCLSGTQGAHIRNLRNDYTGACHLISTAT